MATDQKVGGSNPLGRNTRKIAINPVNIRVCGYFLFHKTLLNYIELYQIICPIRVR